MPLKFWDHAFQTAVYLINRLPTAALNFDIPFLKLHQKVPDYKFLKIFGCSCFPFLRPYNTNKLEFRSKECVFLGYSNTHRGYKCLSPSGRTYISKDVVFNETSFPYTRLFSTSSTGPTSLFPTMSTPLVTCPCPTPLDSLTATSSSHMSSDSLSSSDGTNLPNPTSPTTHSSSSSTSVTDCSPSPSPSLVSSGSAYEPSMTSSSPSSPNLIITRSKSTPFSQILLTHLEPTSVKQALTDPLWKTAMHSEYNALLSNNTWTLVPLPPNREAIGCKWIFRIKENADGTVN